MTTTFLNPSRNTGRVQDLRGVYTSSPLKANHRKRNTCRAHNFSIPKHRYLRSLRRRENPAPKLVFPVSQSTITRQTLRRRHATASWTYLFRLIKLLSSSSSSFQGGIRPLLCGSIFRRCFASLAAASITDECTEYFTRSFPNFLQCAGGLKDGTSICAKILQSGGYCLGSPRK